MSARPWLLGGLLAVVGSLAGCSVMQIDVDVYKGSLANERHVQVQQLVALATGAKPLLTELRDRLQWPDDDKRERAQRARWYREGYLPKAEGAPWQNITNPQAKRVNAVLSLYDDAVRSGLGPHLADARGEIANFNSLSEVVEKSGDRAFWGSIRHAMTGDTNLRRAYREFVVPGPRKDDFRKTEGIQDAYLELPYAIRRDANCRSDAADWYETLVWLQDRSYVECHADILYGAGSSGWAKSKFVDRVVEIADAFIKRQEALRRLWQIGLRVLDDLARPDYAGTFEGDTQERLIRQVAGGVAMLTQHQRLVHALDAAQGRYGDFEWCLKINVDVSSFQAFKTNRDYTDSNLMQDFASMNGALGEILASDALFRAGLRPSPKCPNSVATRTLRDLDRVFIDDAKGKVEDLRPGDEYEDSEQGYFNGRKRGTINAQAAAGLVRSAEGIEDDTIPLHFDEIQRNIEAVASASAVGLERGRLSVGINTLTEAYLDAQFGATTPQRSGVPEPDSAPEVAAPRTKLVNALIRFAEKITTIANFQSLMPENAGYDAAEAGPGTGGRTPRVTRDLVEQYVLVLQAVGNSIEVQANEMLARRNWDRRNAGANADIEDWALRYGLRRDPADTLQALRANVTNRLQAISAQLQAAEPIPALMEQVAARQEQLDEARTASSLMVRVRLEAAADDDGMTISINLGEKKVTQKLEQDTTIAPTQLRDAIRKLLENSELDDVEAARRKTTRSVLDSEAMDAQLVGSNDEGKPEAVLPDLRGHVQALTDAAESALQSARAELTEALATYRKQTDGTLDAEATPAEARDLVARLRERKSAHSTTRDLIVRFTPEVLQQIASGDAPSTDPIELLDRKLAESETAEEGAAAARGIVADQAPAQLDPNPPASGDNSVITTFDKLVRGLEHAHNRALRERGPDAPQTQRLAAAVDEAYKDRADLIYVRPASAYLRTVYAASGLQTDPQVGWRNMLGEHALRSLPLIGGATANEDAKRLETLAEIDRQSWQRINSVRVAGAGDTNYALAKDDIGNWYVKSYSSDTKEIIESARQLALFNIGGGLDTTLLDTARPDEGEDEGEGDDEGDGEAADFGRSKIAITFEEDRSSFREESAEHYALLRSQLEQAALVERLQSVWPGEQNDDFDTAVENAHDETLAPVLARQDADALAQDGDAEALGAAIADVLTALLDFRDALAAKLALAKTRTDENQEDLKANFTSASADAKRVLANRLDEQIERRREAIDGYQATLATLGRLTRQ